MSFEIKFYVGFKYLHDIWYFNEMKWCKNRTCLKSKVCGQYDFLTDQRCLK